MTLHESWMAFGELALHEHSGGSPVEVREVYTYMIKLNKISESV